MFRPRHYRLPGGICKSGCINSIVFSSMSHPRACIPCRPRLNTTPSLSHVVKFTTDDWRPKPVLDSFSRTMCTTMRYLHFKAHLQTCIQPVHQYRGKLCGTGSLYTRNRLRYCMADGLYGSLVMSYHTHGYLWALWLKVLYLCLFGFPRTGNALLVPAQKNSHLDDLTRAIQARVCQRGFRQRGTLYHRSSYCVQKACPVPGRDSQDLHLARQERNETHEARHAQLRCLLVASHRSGPSIEEVVQAYATQGKCAKVRGANVTGGVSLEATEHISTQHTTMNYYHAQEKSE